MVLRPKLDGFAGFIDQWLIEYPGRNRKQRDTAKWALERLRREHGLTRCYTIIEDYVREQERRGREMFVAFVAFKKSTSGHHQPVTLSTLARHSDLERALGRATGEFAKICMAAHALRKVPESVQQSTDHKVAMGETTLGLQPRFEET